MKLSLSVLALVGSAAAFSPGGLPKMSVARRPSHACMAAEAGSSRRDAMLTFAAAAAVNALPRSARADDNEDAMAKIAANNAQAQKKEKEERLAKLTSQDAEAEDEDLRGKTVGAAIAASVLLSVPFYYKNLIRLAIKVTGAGPGRNYD